MILSDAKAQGFIVAEGRDGAIIWGVGATAEAALADALAQGYHGRTLSLADCIPASASLIRTVSVGGGAVEWAIWDGIAQTLAESVRR